MTSWIIMMRTEINYMQGDFGGCYNYASTGFDNYAMLFGGYMMANNTILNYGIRGVYAWESGLTKICFNRPYPKTSSFTNWDKCVNNWATAMQYDSLAW